MRYPTSDVRGEGMKERRDHVAPHVMMVAVVYGGSRGSRKLDPSAG